VQTTYWNWFAVERKERDKKGTKEMKKDVKKGRKKDQNKN
jgi:hypothetical protein